MKSVINLIKGDSAGDDTDYRDQLPVNMSAVVKPVFGAAGYMRQEPGLVSMSDGHGVDRGGVYNSRFEQHYRVSGNSFIRILADRRTFSLGEVGGGGVASMPYSFNTQAIITNNRMWLYDQENGLREVLDEDLGDPIDGTWINGLYLLTDGESLYHTNINDESSIDPLDFGSAEFMPDGIIAVDKTSDNQAIVFGRFSTEFFVFDAGNQDFAFTRVESRAIKAGVVGKDAKCEIEGRYYILGGSAHENVTIRVLGTNHSQSVATREVEKIIGKYNEAQLSRAILEPRIREGYAYLIVHLPADTLMLNVTLANSAGLSQAWSVLRSGVNQGDTYRGVHGVWDPRFGRFVYGDKLSENIGYLDDTETLHFGTLPEWELNTPFMMLEGQSIDKLEIEMVPGYNDDADATVAVSLTYEGVTHGREYFKQYGTAYVYDDRFICRRLGYVRDYVSIKLRGTTRTPMAFSRAHISHG